MKKVFIVIIILSASASKAQELNIYQTPYGFFVPLGQDIPYDFSYRISRKSGDGTYQIMAEVHVPSTLAEYRQHLNEFNSIFEKLKSPIENQINRTWEHISNGGSADSLYLVSLVLEQLSLGLAWLDTAVNLNQLYQYKIEQLSNGEVLSNRYTEDKVYAPSLFIDLPETNYFSHQIIEDKLFVKWVLLDKRSLYGHEVFRRDNLKGDFVKINVPVGYSQNLDSTFVHVRDTLVQPYQVYEYKLKPFDLFGNSGSFTDINKISNFTSRDFPVLHSLKAVAEDKRQIKLRWSMEYKPYVRSIKVLRSMSFDSGFVEIAEVSPIDSTYTDILPQSMENYYYRLQINGPEEVSISTSSVFILYESDWKPEPPTEVAANTVEEGILLQWKDKQRNTFGYYVFRKEGNQDFIQISEPILLNDSSTYQYVDSSAILKGDRFYDYSLKTISDSYVLSDFSDTLSARPGINVAIDAPMHFQGRKAEGKVYLYWEDLNLTETNLQGYAIFRKKSFETDFKPLHDSLLSADNNHFIDSTLEKGFAYDYTIRAHSIFGAVSQSTDTLQFSFYLPLPSPPPAVKAQKINEGIRIVWGEVITDELESFHLYKYQPGGEPVQVSTIPSKQHHYLDPKVEKGNLYFYYVTSSNSENIEGRPSEKVSVRY